MVVVQAPETEAPASTEAGAIREARRRQARRRAVVATAVALAALGLLTAWIAAGAGSKPGLTGVPGGKGSLGSNDPENPSSRAFNVRLVPMLDLVGVAGWCEVVEERGVTGGSACGGLLTSTQPFLQILGSGEAKSPIETQVAVTGPQVTAILIDRHRRVPTRPLRGLPYGLRGARVVTRVGAPLAALDGHGDLLPQRWLQPPRQATVRHWRYPQREPSGSCQLQARGLPGLAVRGGAVATAVRPFPRRLVGHAFLPCAATEYVMRGEPLKAMVVLDATQPTSRAADLPSFHEVLGAPGMFAGGELTAMRSGNAWLVAEQGRSPAERMLLLRHLTVAVRLRR